MLSTKEMNFLLSALKQLLSKLGGESRGQKIIRESKRVIRPKKTSDKDIMKKLVFFSNTNPPTDYSRPKSQIAG